MFVNMINCMKRSKSLICCQLFSIYKIQFWIMGTEGNTSFDKHLLVIFDNAKRKSNTDISVMLSIWRSTINDIVIRSKCEDCIEPIPQKVQPRIFVTRNECYIIRKIKSPTFCAPQLTSALLKGSIKKVTSQYKIY